MLIFSIGGRLQKNQSQQNVGILTGSQLGKFMNCKEGFCKGKMLYFENRPITRL